MACASDMGAAPASVSTVAELSKFDCGCGSSCHAPLPTIADAIAPMSPVPAMALVQPSGPADVSRAPLLPPPEFAA